MVADAQFFNQSLRGQMSILYRLVWDVTNAEGRAFPTVMLCVDMCFPDARHDALTLHGALTDTCGMAEHVKRYQKIRMRSLTRKVVDDQITFTMWSENGWPVDLKSIRRETLGSVTQSPEDEAKLSARQVEVLRHLMNGRTSKEMAQDMGISVRTAEFHRAALMSKINARTLADVVRYALERGID